MCPVRCCNAACRVTNLCVSLAAVCALVRFLDLLDEAFTNPCRLVDKRTKTCDSLEHVYGLVLLEECKTLLVLLCNTLPLSISNI